jgi:phosphoribosylamine---glycine ligase
MNVLLLGNGGREHALAWKLASSKLLSNLYIAPGNPGTANLGTNLNLDILNFDQIGQHCLSLNITMVIVGPEEPLVRGICNYFINHPQLNHIAIIGPDKTAAQLEGSKSFAKSFMKKYGIPTASYQSFNLNSRAQGLDYLDTLKPPIVLKADGLAAGKGVLICSSIKEAKQAYSSMMDGKFGHAGHTIVVEEFLDGIEFSMFAITDGTNYQLLPSAKDYKKIGENDTGLNTGGMGAVSPVPFLNTALMEKVKNAIISPTILGIKQEQLHYKGFVFFGLILVGENPYVIEYNCRMGDPETEVVMPRLKTDLLELCLASYQETLQDVIVEEINDFAVTTMAVSGGYPESYEKNKVIHIPVFDDAILTFHSGTSLNENNLLTTSGGRVLALTALDKTLNDAITRSTEAANAIQFENKYFRKDIGKDLIQYCQ